ncbi:iron-containing redox enzyme family protein [Streptomyces sp. NPDC014676]|uniref:iron-containing redox enzyme family protein n=1 Tax=Streptomyces sp. NPDC014676 TaxID=3364879 RepID=UPI0036FAC0F8
MSSRYRTLYLRALSPGAPDPLSPEDGRDLPSTDVHAPSDPETAERELLALCAEAARWGAAETDAFAAVIPGEGEARDETVRRVLRNCAPFALSAGAWLQWLSGPGNSETEPVLRTLTLYAADVGVGLPLADRGSDFRELLRRHGVAEELPGVLLAGSESVDGFSFRLPALLLTMSRLPDTYRCQLLGADLCLRHLGVLPPLAAALRAMNAGDETYGTLDLGAARTAGGAPGDELSWAAVRAQLAAATGPDALPARPVGAGNRVVAGSGGVAGGLIEGFRWALGEVRDWSERLRQETALSLHPDYGVWRLIHTRARQAAVYHSGFRLEGRPLSEWFDDVDAGPAPFLAALARSRLVRPGKPESSPLLGRLIGPKGPMFRIFTEEELALLRRWIRRLPEPGSVLHPDAPDTVGSGDTSGTVSRQAGLHRAQADWPGRDGAARAAARAAVAAPGPAPRGSGAARRPALTPRAAREAYPLLLSRADSPGLRAFAHAYATRWLARSRYALNRPAKGALPERWDRENGLRPWLARAHDQHAEGFDKERVTLPSRAELIDSTLQLAPLIMIDGGWLQGFTDYRLAASRTGHFLFRTYWDELGNGELELNHPRIYRALLRQMGIDLPPTASPEFIAWPQLRDEAFAMPVFWLSVSRFPEEFMPEILGLNLAMELSGVGGSYRDARVALRHHGFSTQFVDLHNTIDNVATGHSAWAADAIDSHLNELTARPGPGGEAEVWERVRVGQRSLNPPTGRAAGLYAALRTVRRTPRLARLAPASH